MPCRGAGGGAERGAEPSRGFLAGQHGRGGGGGGRLTAPRLSLPDGCGELSGHPARKEESRPSDTPLPRDSLLPTRLPGRRCCLPGTRRAERGRLPFSSAPSSFSSAPLSPPQAGGTRAGAAGDGRTGPVNEQRPEGQVTV